MDDSPLFAMMKFTVAVLFLLGLAAAKDDFGDILTRAAAKTACIDFPCGGKYERCEVISGSAMCLKKCPECHKMQRSKPVCGTDGKTYKNRCILHQTECMENVALDALCSGKCPCDPKEVVEMDPVVVHKLQALRKKVVLERRFNEEMTRETAADKAFEKLRSSKDKKTEYLDVTTEAELSQAFARKMKKWHKKKMDFQMEKEKVEQQSLEQQSTKTVLEKNTCTPKELRELPGRLLDWFHVLKSNNIRQNGKQKSSLKEMKFLESKLRSMYVSIACRQDPGRPDNEVFCLEPVSWMFDHLDVNKDKVLQDTELSEIEAADSENCMKKLFLGCDRNMNGTVEKVEFCRCLCVEPPCTKELEDIPTLLVAGVPQPAPGLFTPRCDEDGFYMPKQCTNKECFCVDRNGQETTNTRTTDKKISCADNTISREEALSANGGQEKKEKFIADGLPEDLIP